MVLLCVSGWSGIPRGSSMTVVEKKKMEQKVKEKAAGNSHRKNRSGGKDNCPICLEKQRRPLAGYIQKQISNESSILEEREEEEVKEISPSCPNISK